MARQPLTSLTFTDVGIPHNSQCYVVTPADRIPPWQIERPMSVHGLADITVEACSFSGNVIDLVALLDAGDPMEIVTLSDSTDRIIWKQTLPLTAPIDGGIYYVKVSDTVTTWYSRYVLKVECGSIVPHPDFVPGYIVEDYDAPII